MSRLSIKRRYVCFPDSRKLIYAALLLVSLFVVSCWTAPARAASAAPAWVPGQILVKPKAGVSEAQFEETVRAHGARLKRLFSHINVHVLSVPAGSEQAIVTALSHDPRIAFAELDRIVMPAQVTPDDPLFSDAWDLQTMRLPDAWDYSMGSGVTVAVLDTGIDASHPDLAGKILPGWNVVDSNTDTSDIAGHGTTIAGVIGAVTDNAIGVAAVAPDVQVLPVRVTDNTNGSANFSDITAALEWAADHGARVANISYDVNASIAVSSAAQYMRSKGGVVIVAAGNDGQDVTTYQPNPYMISVAATDASDNRASFSNYGDFIDVAAPGTSIPTTQRGGGYELASGTSYSTAIVSGLSALLFAANNALKPGGVEWALKYGAVDLGATGPDPVFGYGRVDALNSVQLATGINPIDTQPPLVTPPPDVTVEATGPLTAVALGTASAVDNVDGAVTATADNTGPFSVGVHTVTWSATDAAGNTGTATQQVTVTDTTPPAVTAPPAVSMEATGSTTPVVLGSATASDLVDGSLAAAPNDPGPYTVGVHTVTWTATDAHGNTGTATQQVTITDTTPPQVTAPPDVAVTVDSTPATVSLGQATATDLVDGDLPATADTSGPFDAGISIVTWTAVDAHGNVGTATQQVVVILDVTAPTVTAPPDVTVEATGPLTAVALGTASAVDNVDGAVTATADNTGPFSVGVHTVTWSATDAAGNTGTATQQVTVTDTTPPQVTAPPAVSMEATGPTTSVALGSAAASDLVDGAVTVTPDDPGPYTVGVHTVTWTATDAHGNVGTATQLVNVTDTTPPQVSAPPAVSIEATGSTTSVALGSATASDLVDGSITATADNTGPFTVGVHTVTWTATDAHGNTGTATQQVTVTDTTPPQVSAPPAVSMEATGPITSVALGSATASDLVDGSLAATPDDPGPYTVGVHTVTWTATDAHGNVGTATQQVTVTDTTPPQVSAPPSVSIEATGPTISVALGSATASDLVDGSITATADNTGPFTVGVHTVRWTATDAAGNVGTATQQVTVTDTTPPQITPPPDVSVAVTAAPVSVAFGTATATDLVDGVLPATADTSGPFDAGTSIVTWTAVDSHGNVGTATQKVTVAVADGTAPAVAAPPDITAEATGPLTNVNLGTASAVDLTDGPLTATPDDTGPFTVGTHTITWTAVDSAGNTGSAVQHVTIVDSTPPQITLPPDISVTVSSTADSVPLGAAATAYDLVDGSLPAVPDRGGPFTVGSYLVTWTAVDGSGNVGTAVQHVLVQLDTTPPVVTAPPDITIEATAERTPVALGAAVAVDDVNGALTATADDTGPFTVGTHTITWTAIDAAGNKGVALQHVTVTDTTPPDVEPPADVTLNAAGYLTPVDLGVAKAIDLVSGSVDVQPDDRGPFVSGRHAITWTATDGAGNTAKATQVVDIVPTVSLAGDQSVGRGGDVSVHVYLSGAAPAYPVIIPYRIGGSAVYGQDHDALDGEISIDQGTEGTMVFHTVAAGSSGAPDKTVVISLEDPTGAVLGNHSGQTVTITDRNLAPLVRLQVSQGSAPSRIVYADGGPVTVAALAMDPNPGQTLSYDWSGSDNSVLAVSSVTAGTAGRLSFDPADLSAGVYTINVVVSDSGQPPQSTSADATFSLMLNAPALSQTKDTDGDGINDAADGPGDGDEDGIPNYLDAISDPSVLQGLGAVADSQLIVTEAGLHLGLGKTAMAEGNSGSALPASDLAPLPTDNSVTAVAAGGAQYAGTIYDFELSGLTLPGQSARVVLPLNNPLPVDAALYVYHRDRPGAEWQVFDDSTGDALASAAGANGLCPPAGDAQYAPGLAAGDQCVQMTVADGGPNDLDGRSNVAIQSTLAVTVSATADPAQSGTSASPAGSPTNAGGGGGAPAVPALAVLALLSLVKLFRRSNTARTNLR